MLIPDDMLFDVEEEDLIDKYLKGSSICLPSLSDSDKKHLLEGAAVVVALIESGKGVDGTYTVQVMETLLPNELSDPGCDDKKKGYVFHLAVFDFDSFSFFPRPIVSFAVYEDDVSSICEDKNEICESLYDTLAKKVEKLVAKE